ncbi:MAG: DUF2911 domain-containing protein [Bacteroidota bacterium]
MEKFIKKGLVLALGILVATGLFAQEKPSPAKTTTAEVSGTTITVAYSSPGVKGRTIYGSLVPYGKVWRAGANEATTIEMDKDLSIEGETLAAGKYALFAIPGEEEWTIIFNSVWDQWGAYNRDPSKDVLKVTVSPKASSEMYERLAYEVDGSTLSLIWENTEVPIALATAE